jgi:isocitrate dehydrogenase kinase/phosphatase
VRETQITMMEVEDHVMMPALVKAHSKCSVEFLYLQTETLVLRHVVIIRRMMTHFQEDDVSSSGI